METMIITNSNSFAYSFFVNYLFGFVPIVLALINSFYALHALYKLLKSINKDKYIYVFIGYLQARFVYSILMIFLSINEIVYSFIQFRLIGIEKNYFNMDFAVMVFQIIFFVMMYLIAFKHSKR